MLTEQFKNILKCHLSILMTCTSKTSLKIELSNFDLNDKTYKIAII